MFDFLGAKVVYMRGEYEKAAELFHEGAREGDVMAAFAYGYCLLYGIGVPVDYAEAKSYFVFARDLEGGEVTGAVVDNLDLFVLRVEEDVDGLAGLLTSEVGCQGLEVVVVGLPDERGPCGMAQPQLEAATMLGTGLEEGSIAVIAEPA